MQFKVGFDQIDIEIQDGSNVIVKYMLKGTTVSATTGLIDPDTYKTGRFSLSLSNLEGFQNVTVNVPAPVEEQSQ